MDSYKDVIERLVRLETRLENGLKADINEIKEDIKTLLTCVKEQGERTARLEEVVANHARIIWGIIIAIAVFTTTSIIAFVLRKIT